MDSSLPAGICSTLLYNLKDPYVFADGGHIIRYMNSVAVKHYKGCEFLSGASIFLCHNSTLCDQIIKIFKKMKSGLTEDIITDNEKHRIYMRSVRDENGNLTGYYERFESPVKR